MSKIFRTFKINLRYLFIFMLLISSLFIYQYIKKKNFHEDSLKAPSFQLKDQKDQTFHFPDPNFQGITLIHFWASWCEPCIDELPELLSFISGFSDKNVRLLAISLDQNWTDAQTILDQHPVKAANIIQLIDPDLKVPHQFGSFQYPETIVIHGTDKILTKWVGPQKWNEDYYKKLLTFFIEKKPQP